MNDKSNTETGTGAPCRLPQYAVPGRAKMRLRGSRVRHWFQKGWWKP